ncbi:peptide chain release factor N(5)-glutamine methyltransferase [Croceicoccus hydrothermalis]|uniref:peptide chain release factor N(5)-glutamine methyltransferase n=1 Tax=Croceicoccus hydrothermalis TaxID=2867964 RepID=UPI001EFB2D41|nr:peptide chain release factor N(5)-glutamine methyltransferase [Croceicoccus hydrothermalis]
MEDNAHETRTGPNAESAATGRTVAERTIAGALRDGAARLAPVSDNPRLDAEWLMAEAMGTDRSTVLLQYMDRVAPERFDDLVDRRASGEPLAHITGRQEFYGLELAVSRHVLIPRADSEVLINAARDVLADRPPARILDMGVGSGALLLAALSSWDEARGVGIDRSGAALAMAQHNAEQLDLAARTELRLADWTEIGWESRVMPAYDLVLANPPYVATRDPALADDVRRFEPEGALFAGEDGLDAYRTLIPQLPDLMTPGGVAMVEIGFNQADAVIDIAARSGLRHALHHDLSGHPRALELWVEQFGDEELG